MRGITLHKEQARGENQALLEIASLYETTQYGYKLSFFVSIFRNFKRDSENTIIMNLSPHAFASFITTCKGIKEDAATDENPSIITGKEGKTKVLKVALSKGRFVVKFLEGEKQFALYLTKESFEAMILLSEAIFHAALQYVSREAKNDG